MNKRYNWSEEKNILLQKERNISFEVVVQNLQDGNVIDIYEHPNRDKYPNQKLVEVLINDYIWVVAFVESSDELFLKTAFPSRKANKKHKE